MNDSTNSSKGLLVLRIPTHIGMEAVAKITRNITPLAEELGLEPMVLDGGADARIETGTSAILSRIADALEEIASQGRAPEVSEAQIAPQALNARPTGLNSRTSDHPSDRSGQLEGAVYGLSRTGQVI